MLTVCSICVLGVLCIQLVSIIFLQNYHKFSKICHKFSLKRVHIKYRVGRASNFDVRTGVFFNDLFYWTNKNSMTHPCQFLKKLMTHTLFSTLAGFNLNLVFIVTLVSMEHSKPPMYSRTGTALVPWTPTWQGANLASGCILSGWALYSAVKPVQSCSHLQWLSDPAARLPHHVRWELLQLSKHCVATETTPSSTSLPQRKMAVNLLSQWPSPSPDMFQALSTQPLTMGGEPRLVSATSCPVMLPPMVTEGGELMAIS